MSRILIQDENQTLVAENLILAESLSARMKGLLGRAALLEHEAMLLRPCRSIHMWFMRFPIDVIFLDQNLRVIKAVSNLKPWQLAIAPRRTHCVLEAAAGKIRQVNLSSGDQLTLDL